MAVIEVGVCVCTPAVTAPVPAPCPWPIRTVDPAVKPVPTIVIVVPPVAGPLLGDTEVTVGRPTDSPTLSVNAWSVCPAALVTVSVSG